MIYLLLPTCLLLLVEAEKVTNGYFKKAFLSSPILSKLAELIDANRNMMPDYFQYIEDAGMITQLRDNTGGVRGLGKIEKVYLDNANLIYSLAEGEPNIGNIRETILHKPNKSKKCGDIIRYF